MDTTQFLETRSLSRESFARLAQVITSEIGIKMPDSKMPMVQSRLIRRVRELRLGSVEQYSDYLLRASNHHERGHLINAITTNKTEFFREAHHFAFLRSVVLPALTASVRTGASRRLRVWSAGCSSGEEPYSIALTMRKAVMPWMRLALRGITHPPFDESFLNDPTATLFVLAPPEGSIAGAASNASRCGRAGPLPDTQSGTSPAPSRADIETARLPLQSP